MSIQKKGNNDIQGKIHNHIVMVHYFVTIMVAN